MSFLQRIQEAWRRSGRRKDDVALDRLRREEDDRQRRTAREGSLPPHEAEVRQPRQYPPSDSGVSF